jgi:hypothetical protein
LTVVSADADSIAHAAAPTASGAEAANSNAFRIERKVRLLATPIITPILLNRFTKAGTLDLRGHESNGHRRASLPVR